MGEKKDLFDTIRELLSAEDFESFHQLAIVSSKASQAAGDLIADHLDACYGSLNGTENVPIKRMEAFFTISTQTGVNLISRAMLVIKPEARTKEYKNLCRRLKESIELIGKYGIDQSEELSKQALSIIMSQLKDD